jgi:hypothetical protein
MSSDLSERHQPGNLSYVYGSDTGGRPLQTTLDQQTPLLVLGQAGMGKTCLAAAILHQLYEQNGADRLQVSFLDLDNALGYLFEEQPHTARIGITEHESESILKALLLQMRQTPRPDQPYQLLVIDEFLWMLRDEEQLVAPFTTILSLCAEAQVREHYGVIATGWRGVEQLNAVFRTTIQFASSYGLTQHPAGEVRHLLGQRQFFVAGPEAVIEGVCEAPIIRLPLPGGQELFWKPIDWEHFQP